MFSELNDIYYFCNTYANYLFMELQNMNLRLSKNLCVFKYNFV